MENNEPTSPLFHRASHAQTVLPLSVIQIWDLLPSCSLSRLVADGGISGWAWAWGYYLLVHSRYILSLFVEYYDARKKTYFKELWCLLARDWLDFFAQLVNYYIHGTLKVCKSSLSMDVKEINQWTIRNEAIIYTYNHFEPIKRKEKDKWHILRKTKSLKAMKIYWYIVCLFVCLYFVCLFISLFVCLYFVCLFIVCSYWFI